MPTRLKNSYQSKSGLKPFWVIAAIVSATFLTGIFNRKGSDPKSDMFAHATLTEADGSSAVKKSFFDRKERGVAQFKCRDPETGLSFLPDPPTSYNDYLKLKGNPDCRLFIEGPREGLSFRR